jgi:capsular exopolysaccharide synthesis family protein
LIEYLDDTVKTSDDVTALGVVNLAAVGRFDSRNPEDTIILQRDPRSPFAEAFRTLRTNIQFAFVDRPLRVLLVSSTGPDEGKSTVAANLAAALAQTGKSVVLVDADLRKPTIHRILKVRNNVGLTDALLRDGEIENVISPTSVENLKVLASGPLPPNAAELVGSERMGILLGRLKKQTDIVILDSPPCLVVSDATILSKRADGVLLVIKAGGVRRDAVRESVQLFHQVGAYVAGTVLNMQDRNEHDVYKYRYYLSGEPEGKKSKKRFFWHFRKNNGHEPGV